MLAALAVTGWQLGGDSTLLSVLAATALPTLAAGAWGVWVAPKATRRLKDPARLGLEVALFGVTCLGLAWYVDGGVLWAAALAAAFLLSAPVGRKGY